MIKIAACLSFIIFSIFVNCGGTLSDHHGYIGVHYWYDSRAFQNGFKGFRSVFVTAAFVFGGIELVANNTTLAGGGIKPRLLTYIDKQCRPLRCVVIQPLFCWLDYIGEAAATATIFTAINDGQPEL